MKRFVLAHGFSGIPEFVAFLLMIVYGIPALLHFLRILFLWQHQGEIEYWKKNIVILCYLVEMFSFMIMPTLFLLGQVISGMIALSIGLLFSILPARLIPRKFQEPEWMIKRVVALSWVISLVGYLIIPK